MKNKIKFKINETAGNEGGKHVCGNSQQWTDGLILKNQNRTPGGAGGWAWTRKGRGFWTGAARRQQVRKTTIRNWPDAEH